MVNRFAYDRNKRGLVATIKSLGRVVASPMWALYSAHQELRAFLATDARRLVLGLAEPDILSAPAEGVDQAVRPEKIGVLDAAQNLPMSHRWLDSALRCRTNRRGDESFGQRRSP
jgi:hypothetical protein